MDRHRIELQIRAILVTFRGEQRRQNSQVMQQFRRRAAELIDQLQSDVDGQPDLEQQLDAARKELGVQRPTEPEAR